MVGVALCVLGAVGWLYLLRHVAFLDAGPRVAGSLPLQQLAGEDAQPLLRLIIAWVPAGAAAAALLGGWAGLRPVATLLTVACVSAVLLVAMGAASDAAAISETVRSHVPAQFTRAGNWAAAGLFALGALVVTRARP